MNQINTLQGNSWFWTGKTIIWYHIMKQSHVFLGIQLQKNPHINKVNKEFFELKHIVKVIPLSNLYTNVVFLVKLKPFQYDNNIQCRNH